MSADAGEEASDAGQADKDFFVPSRDLPFLCSGRQIGKANSLKSICDGLHCIANALGVGRHQEEHIVVRVTSSASDHLAMVKEGADLDPDTDMFELHYVRQWLLRVNCMGWLDAGLMGSAEYDEMALEKILAEASRLMAVLSGQSASGNLCKAYGFECTEDTQLTHVVEAAVIEDSLGGRTWNSALLLSNHLLKAARPTIDRHPRILELGAGTGLVGLSLALRLSRLNVGGTVHLTDFNKDVLCNLQRNAALNGWKAARTSPEGKTDVQVRKLDWAEPDFDAASDGLLPAYDCLVGADCIYEPRHTAMLRDVALRYLDRRHALCLTDDVPPSDSTHWQDLRGKIFLLSPHRPNYSAEMESIYALFPPLTATQTLCGGTRRGDDPEKGSLQLCITREHTFIMHSQDNFGPPLLQQSRRPSADRSIGRKTVLLAHLQDEQGTCNALVSPTASAFHYRLYIIEWRKLE